MRRAQSLFFKLLGLKSEFKGAFTSQPVCSSEPQTADPHCWVTADWSENEFYLINLKRKGEKKTKETRVSSQQRSEDQ